jgi:uncharacterized protein DUF4440
MMSRLIRVVPLALALLAAASPSVSNGAGSRSALGSRLVNRYLTDLQRHDVADLRAFLSPAFQVQRADGRRQTKSGLLRDPPRLGSYTIRRMRVSTAANTLVVTFQIAVDEVINGKPFRTGYAARLATFVGVGKSWQLIGWANFNAPR